MARVLALIGMTALTAATVLAQAADPATGTWELNVAQSTFVPTRMAPQRQTRTYRVEGDQDIARHTGLDAEGHPTVIEFTATLDGKICALKGYADWEAISMKKVDAYTTEFTQYRDGKATLFGKRVVSKDGKTMTVSAQGTAANGEKVDMAMVFVKIDGATSR